MHMSAYDACIGPSPKFDDKVPQVPTLPQVPQTSVRMLDVGRRHFPMLQRAWGCPASTYECPCGAVQWAADKPWHATDQVADKPSACH